MVDEGSHGSSPVEDGSLRDALVGGVAGGLVAAVFVAVVTSAIKDVLARVSRGHDLVLVAAPFVGIALAGVLLHRVARGQAVQRVQGSVMPPTGFAAWLRFPPSAVRADLTADVVAHAGTEERFPWRLAPVRAAAILATVGSGAPMGTESPAAHLGMASGVALGTFHPRWRRLARPAGLGGGAAGVATLVGLPLVGLAFVLELGRRNDAPIDGPRVVSATSGALVGWALNQRLGLDLIRLIVPAIAPRDLAQALATAALVGATSGALCSITGTMIYRVRSWAPSALMKIGSGMIVLAACIVAIRILASPTAAIGPGAGAVAWAEGASVSAWTLLAIAGIRAVATTAAVAAGGCGGLFVPFLAIGDLCGRAFAPGLGANAELAAASGSAGAIAGGYRLPITAVAMVGSLGGPAAARLTCAAAVGFAAASGVGVAYLLDRVTARRSGVCSDPTDET